MAKKVGLWRKALPTHRTPVTTLKSTVIATRFPVLSAIQPPTSCETADASELIACTYPISMSLAPDEVMLNPTNGLATLFAREFQNVWSFRRSLFNTWITIHR